MGRAIEPPKRVTGSLVSLRPVEPRDASVWAAAFVDDPQLGPAAGSEEDPDEAAIRERIARGAEFAREGRAVELAIPDPIDDRLVGTVILHSFDRRHERAEVGFWLTRDYRGRGAATEAVGLMVDWAFAELGLHRVEMITLPALPHINRVLALAERLGFRREGVMRERNLERGRRQDTMMLAVLREEWAPLRGEGALGPLGL